jgi:hypothetical protein
MSARAAVRDPAGARHCEMFKLCLSRSSFRRADCAQVQTLAKTRNLERRMNLIQLWAFDKLGRDPK